MESVYNWDRSEKLFAIRCCKLESPEKRAPVLQQLIVDDDPVVRGKAALAMKPCNDKVLTESAEALLDLEQSETSILAMELLGFTDSTDFGKYVRETLNSDDERVVKSAIETIHLLPIDTAIELLGELASNYGDSLKKPILRTLEKISDPNILPVLQESISIIPSEDKVEMIRIAASLDSEEASTWAREKCHELDLTEQQRTAIGWLLSDQSL